MHWNLFASGRISIAAHRHRVTKKAQTHTKYRVCDGSIGIVAAAGVRAPAGHIELPSCEKMHSSVAKRKWEQ